MKVSKRLFVSPPAAAPVVPTAPALPPPPRPQAPIVLRDAALHEAVSSLFKLVREMQEQSLAAGIRPEKYEVAVIRREDESELIEKFVVTPVYGTKH